MAGPFTLTSISSFDHFTRNQNEDADDSIYRTAWDTLYSAINQFSQEVSCDCQGSIDSTSSSADIMKRTS